MEDLEPFTKEDTLMTDTNMKKVFHMIDHQGMLTIKSYQYLAWR